MSAEDQADAGAAGDHEDQAVAVPPAGPEPLISGTFALYPDGAGGFVLVTETTAHGVVRKHIPAAMVKLAQKMLQGGGMLGKVFR